MNILFIGLVKFEIKQWFLAYQDKFCAWFSLARLPTETARVFFLSHFVRKKRLYLSSLCFSYLFNALVLSLFRESILVTAGDVSVRF